MSPKLISIFLPDGNPNALKIAEISNRNIRALLIPRPKLTDAIARVELNQPALYVLTDRDASEIYIGECENFLHRVKSHDQKKDFWDVALVFVAKDSSLEKGDVKYLESLAVEIAKDAERTKVTNLTVPARNNLHEFKAQTILEFFDDLKLLISALGYPVFDKIKIEEKNESEFWYCDRRLTKAKAIYDENGFTVIKGSIIDATVQPSLLKYYPYAVKEREELISQKASLNHDKVSYTLKENITFSSANKAGGFVVGANINAWTNWKNKAGKTMDEVLR
ncbi:MAG: hypothetical protein JWO47_585 [Candidatus Saccharibacteria bacterium]|nr:hypothetical protein [Candidatus Saccharibacteria bacterium]